MTEPTFYEWADTLPESVDPVKILREFFDSVRFAKDVFEVNVAAGIAWNALRGHEG